MPCYHPKAAWREPNVKRLSFSAKPRNATNAEALHIPCGTCIGCRQQKALNWALRCSLELQIHTSAVFTTLTYNDKHKPPTLHKPDLQKFFKRLRKALGPTRPTRFFATGEYGERTHRPHYHAIIYGLGTADADLIEQAWTVRGQVLGHTRTEPATAKRISYVAGYTAKKYLTDSPPPHKLISPDGEEYTYQPPFLQMSRNPGIAAHARAWPESWKLYAIHAFHKMPVPKYLHKAWQDQATDKDKEELRQLKQQYHNTNRKTDEQLTMEETIAKAKQQQQADRRRYA